MCNKTKVSKEEKGKGWREGERERERRKRRRKKKEKKEIKIWTLLTWTRKLKHCGGRSGGNISVQILVVVERGLVVHQRGGPQLLLGVIKNVFFFHGQKTSMSSSSLRFFVAFFSSFFLSFLSPVVSSRSTDIRHYPGALC